MVSNYHLDLVGVLLVARIILGAVHVQAQDINFRFANFTSNDSFLTVNDTRYDAPTSSFLMNEYGYNNFRPTCGKLLYNETVRMKDSASGAVASFNTSFTFQVTASDLHHYQVPGSGDGMAFTFARNINFTNESNGASLCLLNDTNNGMASNRLFAVEFDTFLNVKFADPSDSHIAININSMNSSASYSYNLCGTWGMNCSGFLNKGNFTAWIDYDSSSLLLQVFFGPGSLYNNTNKPPAVITVLLDPHLVTPFADLVDDHMYVGFSASTGAYAEVHHIQSWTFSSSMPDIISMPSQTRKIGIIAGVSAGAVAVLLVLGFFIVRHQRRLLYSKQEKFTLVDPNLSLHMYRYKELRKATNNFNRNELLGTGGYGAVYKGMLPSGLLVAVKRMRMENKHGKESFQAEVTSLSQIRHRNLVGLRGWCHEEEQLLLVYDYMCNGSLDQWLFHLSTPLNEEGSGTQISCKASLPLSLRHCILSGVAAALTCLHEECSQCVLHRDIKSSNVLLDADWNAYLGDFGHARLIDHQKMAKTTMMAGTFGYIAPELLHTGQATKESDVYSFGVVMLEVVCGTRALEVSATEGGVAVLVDTVWRAHEAGNILEVADRRLKAKLPPESDAKMSRSCSEIELQGLMAGCNDHVDDSMLCSYTPESAVMENYELITNLLHLGLLCCNTNPEDRPSMRVVSQLLQLSNEDMEMSLPPLPDHKPQAHFPQPRVSEIPSELLSTTWSSSSVPRLSLSTPPIFLHSACGQRANFL